MREESRKERHVWWHTIVVFFLRLLKDIPQVIAGISILLVGVLFLTQMKGPLRIIVGLSGVLAGASIVFIHSYEIWQSLLDRGFSKSHCPLCPQVQDLHYEKDHGQWELVQESQEED